MTLVSVIIPVHNAERWIVDALRSVVAQRDVETEVIVIDDGSTDSSAERIARTIRGRSNFALLRKQQNEGIVAALNQGLDIAKGEFIARMDADDLCAPERLARQIKFLDETGHDLCGSWFVEFGQGISRRVRWPHEHSAVHAAFLFQNSICHPTILARREVFGQLRYREEYRLAEDYDLLSRASQQFRLANVPDALLRYRRHPAQTTQAKRATMEQITCRIRVETLKRRGFAPSAEEQRLHNLIRAPNSIRSSADLAGIERWLLRLIASQPNDIAKRTIASQWLRACIRAAPLGRHMREMFQDSPLRTIMQGTASMDADIYLLSTLRLDYGSRSFEALRRLGLSS